MPPKSWTINRASSSNPGGLVVDVNDPLRFYLKLPAQTPQEITFESNSDVVRLLKDI